MTGSSSGSPSADRKGRGPAVVLDTNALFLPVRNRFPLEAEIARWVPSGRLTVPSSVLGELDRLAEEGEPRASAARQLAQRFTVEATHARGDDGVLDVAVRLRATLVTADVHLQSRARAQGLSVLAPRDRHRLELLGPGSVSRAPPRARQLL